MQSSVGTVLPAGPGHRGAQMCQTMVSILYAPRAAWIQRAHSHVVTGLHVVPTVPSFTTASSSSSPFLSHCSSTLPPFATLHPSSPPLSIPPPTAGTKLINLAVLIGSDFTLLCRDSPSGRDHFSLFSLEGAGRANLDLDLEILNV